jgi:hypothetical protein
MIGWFYMMVWWSQEYREYDNPEVRAYYTFGEFNCADGCHICIPSKYSDTTISNNTCKGTVESTLVLYDLDNPEDDFKEIQDLSEQGAATPDDITIGSILNETHLKNLKDYHIKPGGTLNYDPNDPWRIPNRGMLFHHNRYLSKDSDMWALEHDNYWTLEVWVRFD